MAIKFLDQLDAAAYTATATTTGATPINPIQNFYPSGTGSDTTTDLAVDQAGNVVRTTQEATWNLTRTQVDALTTSTTGATLISAPGSSSLFVIIEKVTILILFEWNGNKMATAQQYQIMQDGNVSDVNPNKATTIRRLTTDALNTAVENMIIKIRYRVYDTATF